MKKKCTKCGEVKSLSEFYKQRAKKIGVMSSCKCCDNQRQREYRKKNGEKVNKNRRKYCKNNRDKMNATSRRYYKKPPEKFREWGAKWLDKNPDYHNNYMKERRKVDKDFRLLWIIRSSLQKITEAVKKCRPMSSLTYLGCALEEFKAHIESQWKEGMSWGNHEQYGWHIDHIIPISWFVKNSDNPWEANHYTNLQPLWWDENLTKGNKII